ncbi:MAG: type II 3-dehydroquinate dehydratase [Bacteroidota bacterium]
MRLLILNGPNLNMLGKREPEIYGSESLDDLMESLQTAFPDVQFEHFQSNDEGVLVDKIQSVVYKPVDGIILNLAAFTHYSYALYDTLNMVYCPKIEVHISHIYRREEFRHKSVTAKACNGIIAGLGTYGYHLGVHWMINHYSK